MRLWHQDLISKLDGPRLCDLHMTCCNMRGNGWFIAGRNPMVSWAVRAFGGEDALAAYHLCVLQEMEKRHFNYDRQWLQPTYCGKKREALKCNEEVVQAFLDRGHVYAYQDQTFLHHDVAELVQRDPEKYANLRLEV